MPLRAATTGEGAAAAHRAYLKPRNEICNVLISLLSFREGIEMREGLGLYYHTVWREGGY